MGNLTRDPEIAYSPKGTAIADLGLAVNRKWKDDNGKENEETTYIDVTFFGRQAEIIKEYCSKGKAVYIEGRLKLDTWEDKQSGQNRSKLKVTGEQIQFLGGRQSGDSSPTSHQKSDRENLENTFPDRDNSGSYRRDRGRADDDLPM